MDAMEQRRNMIVDLVNQSGNISFAQLKKKIPQISEMTLRTDLKALDEAKRIVRVHGGAKSVDVVVGTDDMLSRRQVRNIEAKQLITQKALQFIRKDTTIFLDSGSTTSALAHRFPNQSNLIYTTGLSCATELANLSEPTVLIPGGKLNRYSISVYGTSVVKELELVNFHQTFLGVMNYEHQTGFTCGNKEEAILKRTAIGQADQVIVLMDSSKTGAKGTYSICGLEDVDIVVSDGRLPEEFLIECRNHNVEVL